MPLTLHRKRKRRSNIDIWNRREEEKNVHDQKILYTNTYGTGKIRYKCGNTT
jgi:hypothetical protein